MALLPKNPNDVVDLIYKTYEARQERDGKAALRPHLGASLIGKKCARDIWYSFRWVKLPKFEGRMLRLFQTGHMAERRFVDDLKSIGIDVHDFDYRTGKQFTVSAFGGHFGGSLDGAGIGVPGFEHKWHVLEFKTHSEKSFTELQKKGVKEAKFQHYSQMNIYMGFTGMERSLYVAVNKNNDQLYAERTRFEKPLFDAQVKKAEGIIFGAFAPGRISSDPESMECRFCEFKGICHNNEPVLMTCRSCAFAKPNYQGEWICTKHDLVMDVDLQKEGCEDYQQFSME
jgi:hypothetical protein